MIAGAVSNLGSVAYFQGDLARAEELWHEAADVFRASGDTNRLASILNNLAELAGLRGDPAAAVTVHEQVLVLRQQLRDPIGLAQSLVNLGKAVQHDRRSGAGQGAAGGRSGSPASPGDRAGHRRLPLQPGAPGPRRGEMTEAARLAGESLAIKHAAGEWFDVAQCLELLAGLAVDRGGGLRAARLLGAAVGLAAQHRRPAEHR